MKTCDIEELKSNFSFDPTVGILTRKAKLNQFEPGASVGYLTNDGYLQFSFHQRRHLAHRAMFAMHYGRWPVEQIDHINGIRNDNRISNLREATNSQNQANTGLNSCNKTGYKGIWWSKDENGWRSSIVLNQKKIYLGLFKTSDEAACAYNEAATRLYGEFARLNPIKEKRNVR